MQLMKFFIQTHGRTLFVGMFFAIMLQGCSEPFMKTNVTVDMGNGVAECAADKKAEVGGCMPPMAYSGYAGGFWHDEPQVWLPTNTNVMCRVGSNKCKSYAGQCQGQSCISRVKNVVNNAGDCYCGCPPIP